MRYFKTFASLIRSLQKINKWISNQKNLYSAGYNLLFNITAIISEVFFKLRDEFVDACGIPRRILLFNGVPFQGSSLILDQH